MKPRAAPVRRLHLVAPARAASSVEIVYAPAPDPVLVRRALRALADVLDPLPPKQRRPR